MSSRTHDHKRVGAKQGLKPRAKAKQKQKGTPYVMVLPRLPRLGASWLVADTALIIGTICTACGRGTFHSLRKAAKELNNPIIINSAARHLGLDLGKADGAMVVVARPAQAGNARRRRRQKMGPRTMAANMQPSGTSLKERWVGVRELAHWHLVRLWQPGREIPYDAAWPEERRRAAVMRWRQAIPAGQLPPRAPQKGETRPTDG